MCPSYFPENNTALPTDSKLRSLAKKCDLLFLSVGQRPSPFPEGCRPLPQDNEQRLLIKIDILLKG
jgi:hypothetical protein